MIIETPFSPGDLASIETKGFAMSAVFWCSEPKNSSDYDTPSKHLKRREIVLVLCECNRCPLRGGRFYYVLLSSNRCGYVYESVMKPQAYA